MNLLSEGLPGPLTCGLHLALHLEPGNLSGSDDKSSVCVAPLQVNFTLQDRSFLLSVVN